MKSKKMLSGEKKYYLSDLGFYYADNTNNEIKSSTGLLKYLYFFE